MTASAQIVSLNDITGFPVLNAEGVEVELYYVLNYFFSSEAQINPENAEPCQKTQHTWTSDILTL